MSLPEIEKSPQFNLDNYATGEEIAVNSESCFLNPEDMKKAVDCEAGIAGYPGEKDKRYKAYKGAGKIYEVIETE